MLKQLSLAADLATDAVAIPRLLHSNRSRTHLVILSPCKRASDFIDAVSPQTLSSEYGKDDSISELYTIALQCFASAEIRSISLDNWQLVVGDIVSAFDHVQKYASAIVVFNLCDGTEIDGYPGISVVRALEQANVPFTGSGSDFFEITTSKPVLKRYLQRQHVPTSTFYELSVKSVIGVELTKVHQLVDEAVAMIGLPLIVKPSVSYASVGITSASVVYTRERLIDQIIIAHKESEGHGIFVEKFFAGREFTAVVVGDFNQGVYVYEVAERKFNDKLPQNERYLAFNYYWDGYTLDSNKNINETTQEKYYQYVLAPTAWQQKLKKIALNAYLACNGTGYGRVDLRTTDNDTCDAFVLEVNANCGLSFSGDASSLGEVLNISDVSPTSFVSDLVAFGIHRWQAAN